MMRLRFLLLALLALAAGCSRQDAKLPEVPAVDQALAMYYVDQLRTRNFDSIDRAAIPSVRGPKLYDALLKMADTMPEKDAPTSRNLVGAQISNNAEGTTTRLIFEYDFAGKWVVANVTLLRKPDAVSLVALSVRAIPESLEARHRFRLTGKSAMHYVVLALAIAFPLLTLYALFVNARTRTAAERKGKPWKTLAWVLFILFGVGSFSINWTTGETQFFPYTLRVFSVSASSVLNGPWTLSVSLPLGAIALLVRRRFLKASAPKA